MQNTSLTLRVMASCLLWQWAASALAAPMFSTSQSAFDTATSSFSSMFMEDFEGISTSFASSSYTGAGVSVESNVNMVAATNSSYCAGTSDCLRFDTPVTGSNQRFSFGVGAINAFSLILGDLATLGRTVLRLSTSTGGAMSWDLPVSARGTERFFGVVDTSAQFTSAQLTNSTHGDLVFLDNIRWGAVQWSQVPEPASSVLFGIGLLGMAWLRRAAVAQRESLRCAN